jgi:hypothetical protein
MWISEARLEDVVSVELNTTSGIRDNPNGFDFRASRPLLGRFSQE